MGWTGIHYNKHCQTFNEALGIKNQESDLSKWEVLKTKKVNNVVYAAIKITHKQTNNSEVFALITLTTWSPQEYYNLNYKDMDETMHPFYYDAGKEILELLTPTENEQANEWRKLCWERIAQQEEFKKLLKAYYNSHKFEQSLKAMGLTIRPELDMQKKYARTKYPIIFGTSPVRISLQSFLNKIKDKGFDYKSFI